MMWVKRSRKTNVIGRIYAVNPTQTELYRLRLLLLHVKGATSFADLRTVNGHEYSTFTEACLALGLIVDDEEWVRALEEANVWMMPKQLRYLFVRILIHCQPVHPQAL